MYANKTGRKHIKYNTNIIYKHIKFTTYFVHIMHDSLMSSDQILAVQSPTVKKFLGKNGFR